MKTKALIRKHGSQLVLMFLINAFVFMPTSVGPKDHFRVFLVFGIAMLACGLASGVTSLLAVLRRGERSWLVWLPLMPALWWCRTAGRATLSALTLPDVLISLSQAVACCIISAEITTWSVSGCGGHRRQLGIPGKLGLEQGNDDRRTAAGDQNAALQVAPAPKLGVGRSGFPPPFWHSPSSTRSSFLIRRR